MLFRSQINTSRSNNSEHNLQPMVEESDEYRLPAVTEPYLPPLDSAVKDSTFTLVLDLDETLIHFFDFSQQSAVEKAQNLGNQGNMTGRTNKSRKSNATVKTEEEEEFGG